MTEPIFPASPLSPEIEAAITAAVDRDRLRLLEIGYYLSGVVTAVFVSFLLIHFSMFLFFGLNPQFFTHQTNSSGHQGVAPPRGLFLGLAGIIGFIILLGWTFGGLQIYAGRCIKNRCHHFFVLIVAGIECLFIPWGTFLGVCTFLVMERPSVKFQFGR